MTKQVYIPDGATNVELPNGYSYDGPETVTLTDEEYADIAAGAYTDGLVIDLEGEVAALTETASGIFVYRKRLNLADYTAAGDVDTFTPGFAGTVVSVSTVTLVGATTAAKALALNLEIGTTNLTGGVVELTTANSDTPGERVAGSAITAANTFDDNDVLTLECAAGAAKALPADAFVEGAVLFEAVLVATP